MAILKRPFLLLSVLPALLALQVAVPVQRPGFVDVAPRSKIVYKSNNSLSERKYFLQPMCGGVAILDYDGDGLLDIFFTNGAKLPELKKVDASFHNLLLRQRPGGTYEDVTAAAGLIGADLDYNMGVAAGDYDNDGDTDLFIAGAARNTLYRNNGDGTFSDITAAAGIGGKPARTMSVAAAWFDYDRDGLLDLVVSNYTFWTPQTDIQCTMGNREFYCDPRRYPSVPHQLFRNLGAGKFADVSEKAKLSGSPGKGMGISIADFNGDGWLDFFIAGDTAPNQLFLNQKDGTFEEAGLTLGVAYNDNAQTGSSMGSDANDFDNDGRPDIFYNNLMGQIWALHVNRGDIFLYRSHATQLRKLSTPFSGWSNGFIDYNNDGWKDIYSANGDVDDVNDKSRQHDTMFENIGGKTLADVSAEMGPDFLRMGFNRGSAFADLNNDGAMDIVVTSLNDTPRILMSAGGSGNHYLMLALKGRKSPRDAIGAKVELTTAGGRKLYNHVAVSVGFMSSSDKRVHFGLGAEGGAVALEITWPSGVRQSLKGVAVDRLLEVEEPVSAGTK